MSSPLPLLRALGWPEDAPCGMLYWTRSDNGDRHGMSASLTLSPQGELVMSSQSSFNGRTQLRFNAHIAQDAQSARVCMPGYQVDQLPVAQAIALFRAHVDAMQVSPSFRKTAAAGPRV